MSELLGLFDLDFYAAETSDEMLILQIDLYHRLIETYGSNIDNPDRGVGIGDRLSGQVNAESLRALGRDIEIDFQKDDRVQSCAAVVTEGTARGSYNIAITVVATAGLFSLAFTRDGQGNLVPNEAGNIIPATVTL